MKKHIPAITIFTIIIGIIVLGIYFSEKNSPLKQLAKLNVYSEEELSFLEEQGFLNNIDSENLPDNKEQIVSLLKSPNLIEQNLNSSDESFEVLATKLDESTYQLAFKLENKSNQEKEFYLIPISKSSQAEFKEIRGVVKGGRISWSNQGDWGYDIEKHKQELRPELAKAYDDIEKNGYIGKPIKLVLEANSTLLAQSKWEIIRGPSSDSLEPIYLLVYGSAGGAKDELTILTVHSSPQQGENWEVEFTTRGTNDLRIIPNDQATIDDDEFTGLYCNDERRIPQILPGDIIFYPDWECLPAEALAKEGNGIGRVVHYTKKAGKHTLRFEFGGQTAFAYNSPGLIDGLVSYWKLDDNLDTNVVLDVYGSNNGTVVNDQTNYSSEQSTTTAKIVRAFDLDGTNDYVTHGDPGITAPPFTINAWFYTSDTTTDKIIFSVSEIGDWQTRFNIIAEGHLSTPNIEFTLGDDANTQIVFPTSTIYSANTWHMATIVGVALNDWRVYLDAGGEGTNSTAFTTFAMDVATIGVWRYAGGNRDYFNGIIDEVGMWNRALTQTEITELYNSGNGLAYPFGGPSTIGLKGSTIRIKGAKVKIK